MRSGKSLHWLPIVLAIVVVALTAKVGVNLNNGLEEITTRHTPTLVSLQSMESDALEGIEEAFGYTVLNDVKEKEEFEARMADFDLSAAAFQEVASQQDEELVKETSAFAAVVQSKAELQAAAEAMFADFERLGVTTSTTVGAFETSVDSITEAFDALVLVEKEELDEHVAGLQAMVRLDIGLLLLASVLLLLVLFKGSKRR